MRIIGQEQIADVFGVAPKTIVEWQGEGFPVALRGGPGVPSEYETEPCIKWLVDREVHKVQGETPRDRLFRLQADELELNMAEKKGLLIHVDAVEPKLRAAVVSAREQLMREPSRLTSLMEGKDRAQREAFMRQSFEAFLRKLSTWRFTDDDAEQADA